RRHTRWPRDWSSDVCSSDLANRKRCEELAERPPVASAKNPLVRGTDDVAPVRPHWFARPNVEIDQYRGERRPNCCRIAWLGHARSEERRVGKECGAGWVRGN